MAPKLQALVLADHIYRDEGTGKYVLAGTFHQVNVGSFPTTLAKTVGAFVCLTGVEGDIELSLEFVDAETGEVGVKSRALGVRGGDPALPVELAVEIPPLPLPHAGRYALRLSSDGIVLAEAPITVQGPAQ